VLGTSIPSPFCEAFTLEFMPGIFHEAVVHSEMCADDFWTSDRYVCVRCARWLACDEHVLGLPWFAVCLAG
jgi:hypothetical protein